MARSSSRIEFTDNSAHVISALEDAVTAYLHEAGGELEAQAKRNSRTVRYGSQDVRNNWKYIVNESRQEMKIGNHLEASYWEELGTGEHAVNGDGRKGWWVYVEGNDTPSRNQKYYSETEAKSAAAFLRSKGLDAHATNGTKPNRPLLRSFTSLKTALKNRAKEVIGARMK